MAERMSDNAVRTRLRDASIEAVEDGGGATPSRRRAPELLIGLLLVVGGAVGGLLLLRQGEDRFVVVGTAREMSRGTVIARDDLVGLEVGRLPVGAATSASDAGSLVGRRVLVDLPAGVPIPEHVTTDEPLLVDSQALVPVALERGAIPGGLVRGDVVRVVISFPNDPDDARLPEMLDETMEVVDIETPEDFGDEVRVTVRTSVDSAIDLARADRIQLVKVAGS